MDMVFRSFDITAGVTIPIIMFLGIVASLQTNFSFYGFQYQHCSLFNVFNVISFDLPFLSPFSPDTISETTM